MPVIVNEMDDDAAIIFMVDSNLQRENILPSERAFSYKMKLEAMKHQAGRPSKENDSQLGNNFGKLSSEEMAEELGTSKNQIFRYIRLSYYNCIGTVSFLTAVYASVPDGEAVRRVRVRKEAAHAEYP